eukprot:gene5730-6018_t
MAFAQIIGGNAYAKLSSLLEVVRLTYEEGHELGPLLAATQLDEKKTEMPLKPTSSLQLPEPVPIPEPIPVPADPVQLQHKSVSRPPPAPPPAVVTTLPPLNQESAQNSTRQSNGSQISVSGRMLNGGPCESCGTTESPQWRRPEPARIALCNRCGIHYCRYKKLPGRKSQDGSHTMLGHNGGAGQAVKRKSSGIASDEEIMEERNRLNLRVQSMGSRPGVHSAPHSRVKASSLDGQILDGPNSRPVSLDIPNSWATNGGVRAPLPKPPGRMDRQRSCPLPRHQQLGPDMASANDLLSQESIDYVLSQGAFEFILGNSQQPRGSQESAVQSSNLAHPSQESERTSHESGFDGPGGKKSALQRKLQLFFSPSQRTSSPPPTDDDVAVPPAEPLPDAQQPAHLPLQQQVSTVSAPRSLSPPDQPERLYTSTQSSTQQPVGPTSKPEQAGEPKQHHYIFKNGMLMAIDGAPADVTAYVSVLGSLLQQQGSARPWQQTVPSAAVKAASDSSVADLGPDSISAHLHATISSKLGSQAEAAVPFPSHLPRGQC